MYDRATYQAVAALHIQMLDKSFLATMGPLFLTELYRAMDLAQDCTLIVERDGNQLLGFVTGGRSMGPIYRAMLPRVFIWGWALGARLLSPRGLKHVSDILRYTPETGEHQTRAELFSIAVSKEAQGKGVAQLLYSRLITYFQNQDIDSFHIMVGSALAPAHKFYKKMGAIPVCELEVHKGERSTLFIQKTQSEEGLYGPNFPH